MFTGILQPTHVLLIAGAVLLFLGPKRLPGAGRALGQGLKEFRDSISGDQKGDTQLLPGEVTAPQDPTSD